jgi:glycosyltransferase involved in cell wall biosynthesis
VKLSVVMAVRDGGPYLREAIESVLAQSVTDFEFLIVDDASSDDTPEILSAYQTRDSRVHVLRNESHLGHCPSANRGLLQASGPFIARHDADDISAPERFAVQLDALQSAPDAILATGDVELFGGREGAVHHPPRWQPRLEWELLFGNAIGAGAHVMFPRLLQGAPVLYSPQYFWAEDYALWCRLSRLGRVVCPAHVVYRYRQHALSITGLKKPEQDECAAAIRHEYQSHYLRPCVSGELGEAAARFWRERGSAYFSENIPAVLSTLTELRINFLAYIRQRYGPTDEARLGAELDGAFRERLAYWLFRSLRARRWNACRDLLSAARERGEGTSTSARALALAFGAATRKFPGIPDA